MAEESNYEAEGTVHVRYRSGDDADSVTFIPRQYVEQRGSKFVVFVPKDEPKKDEPKEDLAVKAIAVKVSRSGVGVDLGLASFRKTSPQRPQPRVPGDPLLHAAARATNVTVVVSCSNGDLALEEIIFPAVPKPAT